MLLKEIHKKVNWTEIDGCRLVVTISAKKYIGEDKMAYDLYSMYQFEWICIYIYIYIYGIIITLLMEMLMNFDVLKPNSTVCL